MDLDRLDERAIQRVSGPAWQGLRHQFFAISRALLSTSPNAHGALTTIYVKYRTMPGEEGDVFAVVWIKTAKEVVVGLALPEQAVPDRLGPAPRGMSYPGLTGYLILTPADQVPASFSEWASRAYANVTGVV
jgi:hypothetical protein